MGPIYRIYQEFLYSTKDLFYVDASPSNAPIVPPKESLRVWLKQVIYQKYRQGYTCDENGEQVSNPDSFVIVESTDPNELVVTMMRVPFQGRTGDPETFEVTYTNTGMTELVTLHAELTPRPYGYNPDTIPIYPINSGGK